jgi:hypothetical protein
MWILATPALRSASGDPPLMAFDWPKESTDGTTNASTTTALRIAERRIEEHRAEERRIDFAA